MRTLITTFTTILFTGILIFIVTFGISQNENSIKSDEPNIKENVQFSEYTTIPSTESSIETKTMSTHPQEIEPMQTLSVDETIPPENSVQVTSIPKYYQTDYPYIKFGNGTIATSGCSITCLAMVSTYLTNTPYYPDQMAYHFGNHGKNNIERLIYGNEQMQLTNVRTDNVIDVIQALKEGKIVIAMMDDESRFTTTQHFIVLAGLNEQGKIIIHDPLEQNHLEDVYMQNGYRDGFAEHDIMVGFSGAWIYDKEATENNNYHFDATIPDQEENRYQGYQLSDHDNYMLAAFLWLEARNEPEQVQQAIAEVILNRVVSPKFPNTVRDVLYKGEYYSKMKEYDHAEPDYPQYRAVTAAMYGPYVLPSNIYYCSIWETQGDKWGTLGSYTFLYSR